MPDIQEPQAPPKRKPRPKNIDRGPNLVELRPEPKKKAVSKIGRTPKQIVFPDKLLNQKVKHNPLALANYLRKLVAMSASALGTEGLNQLYALVQEGNLQAIKLAFETTGLIQPKNGVSIINNNNIDQRSVNIEQNVQDDNPGVRSFAQIARQLEQEAEQRRALPVATVTINPADFAPTPVDRGETG